MVNSYSYNGNQYVPRSSNDSLRGYILASLASGGVMGAIMPLCSKPFSKQLIKEHTQNHLYKEAFKKSIENSGLAKQGVRIVPAQLFLDMSNEACGTNAFYNPHNKNIVINTDKISIAGFHEAGHAMNDLNGKVGKFLSKLRYPGRCAAGLLGTLALFSTPKPKEAPRDFKDWLRDNCGKLAFACMLPTVFEEGMASWKGLKLAKASGLAKPLIKNMQKLYAKALLTYIGHATATGLGVGLAGMIMERYTRPKKVKTDDFFLF